MTTTEAFPLHWPHGWPRTPAGKRDSGARFKRVEIVDHGTGQRKITPVMVDRARDRLLRELQMMGARRVIVSSNVPIRADGGLYADAARRRIDDPGVAVYFALKDRPLVMAQDAFETPAANLASLRLAIEAMRQLERHGGGTMMERAFQGFTAIAPPMSHWAILGLSPGASAADVKAAWRKLVADAHPDRGGSEARTAELNAARDAALKQAAG